MQILCNKLTTPYTLSRACTFTVNKDVNIKDLYPMYTAEHSPIRTQIFWIEMIDIPTYVSVHLVRHKFGVEHFVKSNRTDRCGNGTEDRNTLINHAMFINAQALINMARKRLCTKADPETQKVMWAIVQAVAIADNELADCLVPECSYRGRCTELSSCGRVSKK